MIEFHHVQKTYRVSGRDVPALQSTDLRIEQGQVFGLIGHSGAGKSTLLRLINRLEEPSAGRILVAGEDVTALDATGLRRFRRQVGMIFSIPMIETSTLGSVRHMRPLPSDSTMATVPLSATAKFAPLVATDTLRNFSRR